MFLYDNSTFQSLFQMLDMLTLGWPNLNPHAISMDYEKAVMNSFSAYFPTAEIHGCFFHLVQNMKKHVGFCGLTTRYRQDSDFALQAKMIPAMAFLPPNRIEDALRDLRHELPDDLQQILDWFEDHYMGRLQHRPDGTFARRDATFPVTMWTVHQRTLDGDSRTNNYMEAFHKTLQAQFSVKHPKLLPFIDGIRLAQHNKDAQLERFVAGAAGNDKRNKYAENDRRILRVLETLNSRTLLEFLRGIAHCYNMAS